MNLLKAAIRAKKLTYAQVAKTSGMPLKYVMADSNCDELPAALAGIYGRILNVDPASLLPAGAAEAADAATQSETAERPSLTGRRLKYTVVHS